QWNTYVFPLGVSTHSVERNSRKSGTHFEAAKSVGHRGRFASAQNQSPNSAPHPRGIDKKRSNFRGILRWIKHRVFAPCPLVAAVKRLTLAPASAAHNRWSTRI